MLRMAAANAVVVGDVDVFVRFVREFVFSHFEKSRRVNVVCAAAAVQQPRRRRQSLEFTTTHNLTFLPANVGSIQNVHALRRRIEQVFATHLMPFCR